MSMAVKASEPRLLDVKISEDEIAVFLVDGRTIGVPMAGHGDFPKELRCSGSTTKIIGYGIRIHWPDIDEDISVDGMLYGSPAPRPRSF